MSNRRGLPSERRMRHDRHFVEELSNHSVTGVGLMLPLAQIEANPEQPRTDLGDLEDLTESIRTRGVLEPILVRRSGDGRRYEIVAGERRYRAAKTAGLVEVPCIEIQATDQEALELALIENLQRRDLSLFEEAEGFRTLAKKYEYTQQEIAQAVGKSRITVAESLRLLAIPPAIRDLCRHADITAKSVLLLIARAESIEDMEALVAQIAEGNLDREAARATSQRLRAGEEDAAADAARSQSSDWRPIQIRFRQASDAPVHLNLSIRRPGTTRNEIIATLEDLLARLRRGELDERLQPPSAQDDLD